MSNIKLAMAAIAAIADPRFEAVSGYCQKFARQCIESVYGEEKYAGFRADSARLAAFKWLDGGLAEPAGIALQVGDLLYKTNGGSGHVGILAAFDGNGNGLVAENSSTGVGRIYGAKGFRSLYQFGQYQYVVRLPEPETEAPGWDIYGGDRLIAKNIPTGPKGTGLVRVAVEAVGGQVDANTPGVIVLSRGTK